MINTSSEFKNQAESEEMTFLPSLQYAHAKLACFFGRQSSCTIHSAASNQPSAAPTLPPLVAHPPLKAFLIMAAIKARLALGSD